MQKSKSKTANRIQEERKGEAEKGWYSQWSHLVQTPQISSGFRDKNCHALVVSCVFYFTQVLYKRPVLA